MHSLDSLNFYILGGEGEVEEIRKTERRVVIVSELTKRKNFFSALCSIRDDYTK